MSAYPVIFKERAFSIRKLTNPLKLRQPQSARNVLDCKILTFMSSGDLGNHIKQITKHGIEKSQPYTKKNCTFYIKAKK